MATNSDSDIDNPQSRNHRARASDPPKIPMDVDVKPRASLLTLPREIRLQILKYTTKSRRRPHGVEYTCFDYRHDRKSLPPYIYLCRQLETDGLDVFFGMQKEIHLPFRGGTRTTLTMGPRGCPGCMHCYCSECMGCFYAQCSDNVYCDCPMPTNWNPLHHHSCKHEESAVVTENFWPGWCIPPRARLHAKHLDLVLWRPGLYEECGYWENEWYPNSMVDNPLFGFVSDYVVSRCFASRYDDFSEWELRAASCAGLTPLQKYMYPLRFLIEDGFENLRSIRIRWVPFEAGGYSIDGCSIPWPDEDVEKAVREAIPDRYQDILKIDFDGLTDEILIPCYCVERRENRSLEEVRAEDQRAVELREQDQVDRQIFDEMQRACKATHARTLDK